MLAALIGGQAATIIGIVGVAVAVFGAMGTAWAVFRSNMAVATINLLRDSNEALQGRLGDLERENVELRGRVTQQQQQITTLRDLVTGVNAMAELATMLKTQYAEILGRLDRLAGAK